MSAPPGFNEQASNLPDPGAAAAPIHVMRGGGSPQIGGIQFSKEDTQILQDFGLDDPIITEHISGFDDSFKQSFITQFRSKKCSVKEMSTTRKDCWAVAAVIRAAVLAKFAKQSREPEVLLPGMVPSVVSEEESTNMMDQGQDNNLNHESELSENVRQIANIREENSTNALDESIQWISQLPTDKMKNDALILLFPSDGDKNVFSEYKIYINQARQLAHNEYTNRDNIDKQILTKHEEYIDEHNLRQVITNAEKINRNAVLAQANTLSDSSTRMAVPGNTDFTSAAPNNVYSRALTESAATGASLSNILLEEEAAGSAPPSTVATNENYFTENPVNFRKGQYGINLNKTNDSKRVYANAIIGTKRMRIRGRNATNIKTRYNAKKRALNAEVNRLREARNTAAIAEATLQRQKQATRNASRTAKTLAELTAKRRLEDAKAAAKAATRNYNTTRKEQEKLAKKGQEDIRQAEVAAGIRKPSFMNRMRSTFKRGDLQKTRRNTLRKNRH